MPNKTDRILSYLPRTFRALPKPTALYAVADAFGNELLSAENSLVDVMRAHWIDQADKGAELIRDLACIAALYGLGPRGVASDAQPASGSKTCPPLPADESVEEFREHLKRYIRTFLEGTVTVQGVLRIVAEVLDLRIADDYAEMDTWWTRPGNELVTIQPRGEDAASLLFGFETSTASGERARQAQIIGTIDLSNPVDLSGASVLRLKIDAAAPVNVDLAARVPNPSAATLDQIIAAINAALGKPVSRRNGQFLTLASPTDGPSSRLEVQDVELDAAPRLLGLSLHIYRGSDAAAARVTGTIDLGSGINLSETRYLRLLVDGTHLAEIDCAGSTAGATTLDEIVTAINTAIAIDIASHDGHFLTLTSPTIGFNSSIAFQPPAAQDATQRLFGPVPPFHVGRDARPVEVIGTRDLSRGVDLSSRTNVSVRIDDEPAVMVNCAGADPARTLLPEIVAAFNSVLGGTVASHDGRFIRLASPATGAGSILAFESLPPDEDATEDIFGIGPRAFQGQEATHARLVGHSDLSAGVDLGARHIILVALDGDTSKEVNVRSHATNLRRVTLDEMVASINAAFGKSLAAHDGQHLILTSPTSGAGSHISVQPVERMFRRRFVTRAFVTDEAAQAIFGFVKKQAHGQAGTQARIEGKVDLSRGVDLRDAHFLRIALDGQTAREIDCAAKSPRPRAAMPDEIVAAINEVLGTGVASHDGSHISLTSPSFGTASRIVFESPRASDASDLLLGLEPGIVRGRDATRVAFVGTVDLSAGVDLRAASYAKIGIDEQLPVEINCAGTDPAHTTLNEIVMAINVALGAVVARHDGKRVSLLSSRTGLNSRVEFAAPSQPDATKTIFGISAPRVYHGVDSEPARLIGTRNLSGGTDLTTTRFLRIAVNGQPPRDVDCAVAASDPSDVSLDQIVTAINQGIGSTIASHDGSHLILTSPTTGAAGRLERLPYTSGDARAKLFGDVPEATSGEASSPAVITGEVDLLTPVNLNERRIIRLSVDGRRPVDINVSGAAPEATFLDEIVAKINAVIPGLASATEEDRLRLTSPMAGEASRLELLALRALEVIEYSPKTIEEPPRQVRHSDSWHINNTGAAEVDLEAEIIAPQGAVGPMLVNRTEGWRIRLKVIVRPGEKVHLWRDPDTGIQAAIVDVHGSVHAVPGSDILVESLGAPAWLADRALKLPLGQSEWTYMDCDSARFDRDHFNQAYFAGGVCYERGVFDISRFVSRDADSDRVVFSITPPLSDSPVEIRIRWSRYQQGTFVVNLPADLPEPFGGRFNRARFGGGAGAAETYEGVVTEPANDPDHWVQRLAGSKLVEAHIVPRVPIGFQAMLLPFRRPRLRTLSGGTDTGPARLYLAEDDVPGFVELRAREPGAWGNAIGVSARLAGPARFDVTIGFQGGRFENARQVALAGRILKPDEYPLAALAEELLKPGPVGVLQAKAAGVYADVSRERTQSTKYHIR
ncbi:MAG TPA: hypothetical protein VFR47_05715 [Anaerolineales bacterium]|nr:hypothetical protein [Anaerolineales bacterium]